MSEGLNARRRHPILGTLLIITGLGANKWLLERAVVTDGSIESPVLITILVLFQAALVASGVIAIRGLPAPPPRLASSKDRGTIALNIALSIGSFMFALVLAEAILVLAGWFAPGDPVFPGDLHESELIDPLVGWTMPPNMLRWDRPPHGEFDVEYQANSLGFRDDEFTTPASDRSIAFLGDSFTFGAGVPQKQTFPELLEMQLGVDGLNFGMNGFGVDQMWRTLKHYALPLAPDIVVLSFVADDLRRSAFWKRKPIFRLRDGRLEKLTGENGPGALQRFLWRHSRLLSAWRWLEFKRMERRPVGSVWRLNRAIFEALSESCRAAGIPLVVVYIPTEPLSGWQLGPMLLGEFDEMGIPFLDLTPHFIDHPDELFFQHDPHINARGHEIVAEEVALQLVRRGLIDP